MPHSSQGGSDDGRFWCLSTTSSRVLRAREYVGAALCVVAGPSIRPPRCAVLRGSGHYSIKTTGLFELSCADLNTSDMMLGFAVAKRALMRALRYVGCIRRVGLPADWSDLAAFSSDIAHCPYPSRTEDISRPSTCEIPRQPRAPYCADHGTSCIPSARYSAHASDLSNFSLDTRRPDEPSCSEYTRTPASYKTPRDEVVPVRCETVRLRLCRA